MKTLNAVVFPSEEKTIEVEDCSEYGGAHTYQLKNCNGFNDGKTEYVESAQRIRFVRKLDTGKIEPGLQSEQVVLMLIDRHEKLNARFPSDQNTKMLGGLRMFIEACEERVKDRIDRGVMGNLRK